jgi:hypothetical protein
MNIHGRLGVEKIGKEPKAEIAGF